MNVQRTDYRAKEVESLAKADQTDDEDLKHLHTTIANQWRLLAERTETPLANAAASCPTAMPSAPTRSDVGISWAKDDAGLGKTNSRANFERCPPGTIRRRPGHGRWRCQ